MALSLRRLGLISIGSADVITGDDGDNHLVGGDGDDIIRGLGGDDLLEGGLGRDTLDGGEGTDTADYRYYAQGLILTLVGGTALGAGDDRDSLTGIENVIGSAHDDFMAGDACLRCTSRAERSPGVGPGVPSAAVIVPTDSRKAPARLPRRKVAVAAEPRHKGEV